MSESSTLQLNNRDNRDNNIRFYAKGHKYEILTDIKSKYTSVTTWNKSHFPKFDADAVIANIMRGKNWNPDNKYWGQTPEQIKASWMSSGTSVADAGTNLHEQIEHFMNNNVLTPGYTHAELLQYYNANRNQDTVFGPGKNVEDATKRAIAGGYPAVAPNINWQATPGVANSNELSARNRAAKEMENVGATISDLQKAKDLIGRELNVGENVTTFAKLPLIGGIFNDFRRLFQPDIVALENLAKQAGMGQAKNLVGGRVAVQEMTQIVGALGDANVTQEVRKELAMAYLIGNQNQLDYLRAKEKYVNAFKVVDGFDDRWTEYSMDNPIGNGVPGENYQINENRIPWSLYNVLKNKGYANPNEIASKNEDLVNRETGTFNYNALPNGPDGPWAPSNTLPAAAISNPANPVSGKSSNAASKPQDLKSFIDLNLRGPDGKIRSREDILKLFNEATGGK